jgi:hypothetical protein
MPIMPTVINPLITNAGFNAAQAQSGLGLQLAITHLQLGSGTYVLDPSVGSADYNRTALVTPTETVPVAAGHVMDKGFRVDAMFPAWTAAAYGVSEIGFWAGDPAAGGVLFAIWAQATPFTQRNNIDYLASFGLGLTRVPVGSVTVTFNPVLQEAIALMTYHEQAADPHPQYGLPLLRTYGLAVPSTSDAPAITNLASTTIASGIYLYAAGATNKPAGHDAAGGVLLVLRESSSGGGQAVYCSMDRAGRVFFNNLVAGAFTGWKQVAVTASPAFTGTPTAPTPTVGDNTTKLATTAHVQAAMLGGAGQTLQNLSGSRVLGTTYTNTTGRPIFVQVQVFIAAGGSFQLQRGGNVVEQVGNNTATTTYGTVSGMILPGESYAVIASGGPSYTWHETR